MAIKTAKEKSGVSLYTSNIEFYGTYIFVMVMFNVADDQRRKYREKRCIFYVGVHQSCWAICNHLPMVRAGSYLPATVGLWAFFVARRTSWDKYDVSSPIVTDVSLL